MGVQLVCHTNQMLKTLLGMCLPVRSSGSTILTPAQAVAANRTGEEAGRGSNLLCNTENPRPRSVPSSIAQLG